ncbi:NAD(P)-dependent alcohol dehydrogenase [Streptomyces sp. NPDC088747]|uniref:NAD(P)-dependent alcohol dehydrogenase n=1 Tax=Streptomyces sp. NPDC088747 TaxID=3365886 RepID=UPI0038142122
MRTALYDAYGGPEVLYQATVPTPTIGPDEVLVRVRAAGVNGADLMTRSGKLRLTTRGPFPRGTGIDFTGEVADFGRAVSGLGVGDHVWGLLPRGASGSVAEYVAVPVRKLSLAPEGLDLVQAAALPTVGTTAITALRDKARLEPGERLLVRGAGGGVGSAAIQLGNAYGAHVTALAGAHNLDLVSDLGAHAAFDHRATDAEGLGPFDVVLDTVGTELSRYRGLLAPRGRMISITVDPRRIVQSLAYILGSRVGGRRPIQFFSGNPDQHLFTDLARCVQDGLLRPVIHDVYPLADIAKAHRAMESGGSRGKHVIRID